MTATFTRLGNGEWGLRGAGLIPGRAVNVRTRSRQMRRVVVLSIVSEQDGVQVARIDATADPVTIRAATGRRRDRGMTWEQIRARVAEIVAETYASDELVTRYCDEMIADRDRTKAMFAAQAESA